MQRIYGTAFFSQKELDEHLTRLEEAKKRDHRKRRQGARALHVPSVGAGRHVLAAEGHDALQHARQLHARRADSRPATQEVKAPIVFNKALWETSGHWDYYHDNMFLVKSADGEEMGLKPMNCPGHFLLFGSEMRSYKDLPLRFHEQTPLHRNEASGVLSGLTRVRQFSQDDGHCFVTRGADRARKSRRCIRLIQRVYGDFGLELHGQAVDAAREVPRRGRHVGSTPRRR